MPGSGNRPVLLEAMNESHYEVGILAMRNDLPVKITLYYNYSNG